MSTFVTIMAVIGAIFLLGLLAAIIVAVRFFLKMKQAVAQGQMRIVRGSGGTVESDHYERFEAFDTINADQSTWTSSFTETPPNNDSCQSNDIGSSWDSGDSSDCGSSDSGGGGSSSD